jgi:patatin-like phospholipase/acyl hydrolase
MVVSHRGETIVATKRILAIDGGGIRGLIPALALERIEASTRRPTHALFDVIAGTSTGGILAAGLGIGLPASDLVALYRDNGEDIFNSSIVRKIACFVLGPEYAARSLEARLQEKLGDARLADAKTGLLITSFDMRRGEAWFFRREDARDDPSDFAKNCLLREICRATSAAPTYFAPTQLSKSLRPDAVLVDGGVFANNPAMCALVDKREGANGDTQAVLMLSLGTGSVPHPVTFSGTQWWGKIRWAQPAIGALLDGQADTVEFQLQQLLGGDQYLRLQTPLLVANEAMDNARKPNIDALMAAADDMLMKYDAQLTAFCSHL